MTSPPLDHEDTARELGVAGSDLAERHRELLQRGRDTIFALLADNARMREALVEAESVLALVERPNAMDPAYGDEVEALGRRIGFGALMSSAQASWRKHAIIPGGEFVAGPCFATVIATLKTIRQALSGANHAEK